MNNTIRLLGSISAVAMLVFTVGTACGQSELTVAPVMNSTRPSLTAPPDGAWPQVKARWHDGDGNGWNDTWERVYPRVNTASKTADTDGDGLTDWQEMLMGRDPMVKGPLPRTPTAAELAADAFSAAKQAEERAQQWAQRQPEIVRESGASLYLDEHGTPLAKEEYEKRRLERLQAKLRRSQLEHQRKSAQDGEALARMGRKQVEVDSVTGRSAHFAGMEEGRPIYLIDNNYGAMTTVKADQLQIPVSSAGYGLTGLTLTLGVWELGDPQTTSTQSTTHREFWNSAANLAVVTDRDGINIGQTASNRAHATHVCGGLIAQGLSSAARGLAPAARAEAFSATSDSDTMAARCLELSLDPWRFMPLSNHSYSPTAGWTGQTQNRTINGTVYACPVFNTEASTPTGTAEDPTFGQYRSAAYKADQICYDHPLYLPVWAAGNDRAQLSANPASPYWLDTLNGSGSLRVRGYGSEPQPAPDGGVGGWDCIAGSAVGKNVLTVGSCAKIPGGYSDPADVVVSSFSGAGPMDDGRVKPDIVAPGEDIFSATYNASFNDYYSSDTGTSFAAPVVTGALAMLTEHWRHLHHNGATPLFPAWPNGSLPEVRAATLKALVIHTADAANGSGGPDYRAGWGMLNAKRAADLLVTDNQLYPRPHVKETVLTNSGSISFPIKALGNGTPLKVTIVWTDPPCPCFLPDYTDVYTQTLVNDLELRLHPVSGGGSPGMPWTLDRTSPDQSATPGENHADNVEQVLIPEPPAGAIYEVNVFPRMDGYIPSTLVDESGNPAPQPVTIIVTGNDACYLGTCDTLPEAKPVLTIEETPAGFLITAQPVIVGVYYRIAYLNDAMQPVSYGPVVTPTLNVINFSVPRPTGARGFWRMETFYTPP